MKDEKKTSFFKKIFGRRSACCSIDIEEIDSNEGESPDYRDPVSNCCCSTSKTDVKKSEDVKE